MTEINSLKAVEEKLVALTRDLILIPTIPSLPQEQKRCFDFIQNHLYASGNIVVKNYENNGIASMVAMPKGIHKPEILLCGHLDVITHPDVASYTSTIEGRRIIGPGAGDMKGALAVMIEVFRHIHSNTKNASLGIAITSDEEIGGKSGVGFLVKEKKLRCGQAIIPDGGSLHEMTVEEKGILHLGLSCEGHAAHAARPWLGDNPIDKLIDKLGALKKIFFKLKKGKGHWHPSCAVTIISTENQTVNRVPSECRAVVDIRFPHPFTVKKIKAMINEVLGPEVKQQVIISAEPTKFKADSEFKAITEKFTGKKVSLIRDDGGSDARYFSAEGIPVIMTRPYVGALHSLEEWIDIDSMVALFQIYKEFLSHKIQS